LAEGGATGPQLNLTKKGVVQGGKKPFGARFSPDTNYSIPLSAIIAGIFAKRRRSAKLDGIFYVAVGLAILWNSLFAWRTVELTLAAAGIREDRAKDFGEYIESLSRASTFLISGLLTSVQADDQAELER
jgi:hypothetical protein